VVGIEMSLNDVCVFVPAWFGVLATLHLALLTYECTSNRNAAVASALVMAIIPAHIMRSVAGGYVRTAALSETHTFPWAGHFKASRHGADDPTHCVRTFPSTRRITSL